MKNKKQKCEHCNREKQLLTPSVRAARIEEIQDGMFVDLPNPICADCLEEITEELWRIANEN